MVVENPLCFPTKRSGYACRCWCSAAPESSVCEVAFSDALAQGCAEMRCTAVLNEQRFSLPGRYLPGHSTFQIGRLDPDDASARTLARRSSGCIRTADPGRRR